MCISFNESKMSDTLIYTGEGKYRGQDVHVLAYQNVAENLSYRPNAMVLPFPTSTPMTQDNIIDTSKFPGFLRNITDATKMQSRSLGGRRGGFAMGVAGAALAEVFDVGSYTVILAEKASQIPEALQRVPVSKRPTVTVPFLLGLNKMYPKQPIAICCFNGSVAAEPLLWWYVPTDKTTLFAPTMDAHDGQAPNPRASVHMDHIISTGSNDNSRMPTNYTVEYSDMNIPEEVRSLLPTHVGAAKLSGSYGNGDVKITLGDMSSTKMWERFPRMAKTSEAKVFDQVPMLGWS